MRPIITRHNPIELHNPPGYHHVTVVESGVSRSLRGSARSTRSVRWSALETFSCRSTRSLPNAAMVLAAIGARPDQVVRSVIYVVSEDTSVLAAAWRQLTVSVIGSAFSTASTLLGVRCLGFSGQLVEVDLTAAF